MNSPLRLLSDPPADYAGKPMDDHQPPQPPADIRRAYATSSYCMGVTDDAHADHLRLAAKLKEATGEPYSFQAACVSYMMDLDRYERGARLEMPSQVDYARIWGWSRKQLRARWGEIVAVVEAWRTSFGRLKTGGQPRASEGPGEGQPNDDSAEKSKGEGQPRASEGPGEGQHTITTPANSSSEESISADRAASEAAKQELQRQAEAIYQAYPLKKAKPDALRAILKALKKCPFETLLARTRAYATARADEPPKYTPNPATWFNGERYDDDPSTWNPSTTNGTTAHRSDRGNGRRQPPTTAELYAKQQAELERVAALGRT